jgi:COMPASS component SWD3
MEHTGGINDVAWNPQGNYLATASDDLTARIWDAESGKCLVTLAGHTNYVFCCRFNPVGHILVRLGAGAVVEVLAHHLVVKCRQL